MPPDEVRKDCEEKKIIVKRTLLLRQLEAANIDQFLILLEENSHFLPHLMHSKKYKLLFQEKILGPLLRAGALSVAREKILSLATDLDFSKFIIEQYHYLTEKNYKQIASNLREAFSECFEREKIDPNMTKT